MNVMKFKFLWYSISLQYIKSSYIIPIYIYLLQRTCLQQSTFGGIQDTFTYRICIVVDDFTSTELYYDRGNRYEFTSLVRELARPGELSQSVSYDFEFVQVEKPFESYTGTNVKLRYACTFHLHQHSILLDSLYLCIGSVLYHI